MKTAIKSNPITSFVYFCMVELGRSMSKMIANKIKTIILVTQSVKILIHSASYRTIIVIFPAATITVTVRKNIRLTMANAAKTKMIFLLIEVPFSPIITLKMMMLILYGHHLMKVL